MQDDCQRCGVPFDASMKTIPAPGGKTIQFRPTMCESCADSERLQIASAGRAKLNSRPLADLMPTQGETLTIPCRTCGEPFESESVVFRGDKRTKEKTMFATICDACAEKEKPKQNAKEIETADKKAKRDWIKMTGDRYAEFRQDELPNGIKVHVQKVMAWTPGGTGIGLVGPSRTGKSPLLYALGQKLYVAGYDVFPTSGIEFQRQYHRAIENRSSWEAYLFDCENSEVLLIDDADKLNLTAGVEAEYYGMLENRRNWSRPVLCTLNLTGEEFAKLARERGDRASAIVERLRDLCEFIPVS